MSQDPRSELDGLDRSRADAVRASARPAWVDAVSAALLGAAVAASMTREPLLIGVAVVLLVATLALSARFTRRKGRLTDDRAVTSQMGRYAVCTVPLFVAPLVAPENPPVWVWALAGAAVAIGCFAYLRLDERYQTKRLASGDYGPYDLS